MSSFALEVSDLNASHQLRLLACLFLQVYLDIKTNRFVANLQPRVNLSCSKPGFKKV